jgi:Na+-transporting NADH:ubiquinone oxidoreductase subunit NqrC
MADTSIYGLIKPVQAPSMMESAKGAATLKSLAMQQDQQAQETEQAKVTAHLQKAAAFGDAMEGLAKVPEAQRPQAYSQMYKQMSQAGIITPDQAPPEYDPQFHAATVARYQQTKPYLEKQLMQSQMKLQQSQAVENYAQAEKARREKKNGTKLPAGDAMKLAQADSALSSMSDVDKAVEANKDIMGPTSGVAGLWESGKRLVGAGNDANRYDSFDALMRQKAQEIGTYLEGGKLTDADVPKYERLLPKRGEPPEVAAAKSQMVQRLIADRRAKDQATLGQAGYDVSDITPTGMKPEIPGIVAKGGQKKAGGSFINDAQAGSFAPDVVEYAKKHGISPQQADAIKKARGGK